jgi:integrase
MATRGLNKLSASEIDTLGDGSWSDGGNLYLKVDGATRRSWIFRYTTASHKIRELGLGRAGTGGVSLKDARRRSAEYRGMLGEGLDPLAERQRRQAEQAAKRTFAEVGALTLARKESGFKSERTATSWKRTLEVEAKALHDRPIGDIGVEEVKRVVMPMWNKGHHVAARMSLDRLSAVFSYAIAHGWRTSDNPASWSIFQHIAPVRPNGTHHHPAIGWREVPEIVAKLRRSRSMSATVLEFVILTGVRVSEALGAEFREFDLDSKTWTIPAVRMKRDLEHAVPLSDRAVAIVMALKQHRSRGQKQLFLGPDGKPVSRAVVFDQAKRSSDGRSSVHGFRSSLRSWCSDHGVAFEVAEAILAHSKATVVAAYDRSSILERRRPVMERWSRFIEGEEPETDNGVVVQMRQVG